VESAVGLLGGLLWDLRLRGIGYFSLRHSSTVLRSNRMMNPTRSSNNCGCCIHARRGRRKRRLGRMYFRAIGCSMFAMTDNNHHHSGHQAVMD
jgi:hypothetical protein